MFINLFFDNLQHIKIKLFEFGLNNISLKLKHSLNVFNNM